MNKERIAEKISQLSDVQLRKYLDTEKLNILHALKLYLDNLYYNTGEYSGITDNQYDMLKDTLEYRYPSFKIPVGARIKERENRVKLPFWLGSMDKVKPNPEYIKMTSTNLKSKLQQLKIEKFALLKDKKKREADLVGSEIRENSKYIDTIRTFDNWLIHNKSDRVVIEDKLDGVSCLAIFVDGEVKLYTRGDGEIGADISYWAQYIKTIPQGLTNNMNVRGELIIPIKIFEKKYMQTADSNNKGKKYKNPRNMVSGIIGAKDAQSGLIDIQFIAYEILGENIMPSPSDQLKILKQQGFSTVHNKVLSKISIPILIETLANFKASALFEIDGIIVQADIPYKRNVSGNPDYAFAFKFSVDDVITTVEEIIWNPARFFVLAPTVKLKPIELGGVTISNANGKNAKFIMSKNIGPGSIVKIKRQGDVIPDITNVIKESPNGPNLPLMPYHWGPQEVNFMIDLNKKEDPLVKKAIEEVYIKSITYFFKKIGAKNIAERGIKKMYDDGLNNLLTILTASKERIQKIPGWQGKAGENAYNSIHDALKNITIPQVIGASGILGHLLAIKMVEILFTSMPNILIEYTQFTTKQLYDKILKIDGFSDIRAKEVVNNIKEAAKFIETLKDIGIELKEKETISVTDNSFKDMVVVFTSIRDKKLEEQIIMRGGKVSSGNVTKLTTILVVKSKEGKPTAKLTKAIAQGIEILTIQEFITKYINK